LPDKGKYLPPEKKESNNQNSIGSLSNFKSNQRSNTNMSRHIKESPNGMSKKAAMANAEAASMFMTEPPSAM
jgi:hypothetical protein